MRVVTALLSGLLFGLGLSIGGMTQPAVVLDFLDIFGHWDPRLAFVMGGAVVTTAIGYRLVLRRPQPLFEDCFRVPSLRHFDGRLIGGATLFGLGWGMAGYCPGPALASVGGGALSVAVLLATMILGWWLAARLLPPSRN